MSEIYFSTDVETDGPIPGQYSMLSLASVAYSGSGDPLGSFSINLCKLDLADEHPDTMAFWAKNPKAYEATRTNQVAPLQAMAVYSQWVRDWLSLGKPVFLGYPAGFDFLFVYWYLVYFTGKSPFSFSALDLKTYIMATLDTKYTESTKRNLPPAWTEGLPPHTHLALDDAKEQGELFFRVRAANRMKIFRPDTPGWDEA